MENVNCPRCGVSTPELPGPFGKFCGNCEPAARAGCRILDHGFKPAAPQVTNHYLAAGIAPRITLQPPVSTNVNEGTTLSIPVQVIGSLPLSYQWYDITSGSPGTAVPGQTSPTLVVPNVNPAGYDGHT